MLVKSNIWELSKLSSLGTGGHPLHLSVNILKIQRSNGLTFKSFESAAERNNSVIIGNGATLACLLI